MPLRGIDGVRQHADALLRAARECCRQHNRFARLLNRDPIDAEEVAVDILCRACNESLSAMADAYEKAAAHVRPEGDEAWWHRANALWMASREYARRHDGCDAVTRRLSKHAPGDLALLQAEFELEASALLALWHACEAYCRTRPEAA